MNQTNTFKKPAKWPYVLLIIVGLGLMFLPKLSVIATISFQIALGWFLTLAAVLQIILLFTSKVKQDFGVWLVSIMLFVVGLYFLLNPASAAMFLTWIFAAMSLISGIGNIIHSFNFHGIIKQSLIASGLIGIVFALMIFFSWPFSGMTFIGIMLGIQFVLTGASRLAFRKKIVEILE